MTQIRQRNLAVLLGIMAFWYAVDRAMTMHSLGNCQRFIEARYQPVLAVFDGAMRASNVVLIAEAEGAPARTNRMHGVHAQLAAMPEVYAADWSRVISLPKEFVKPLPSGYRLGGVRSSDKSCLHQLFFGKAADGTQLLVYVGRGPAGSQRIYHVLFVKSRIQQMMRDQK